MKKNFLIMLSLLLSMTWFSASAVYDIPWASAPFTSACPPFSGDDWARCCSDVNSTSSTWYFDTMNTSGVYSMQCQSTGTGDYLDRTLFLPKMNFVGGNTYYVEVNVNYNPADVPRTLTFYCTKGLNSGSTNSNTSNAGRSLEAMTTLLSTIGQADISGKRLGLIGFYFVAPEGTERIAMRVKQSSGSCGNSTRFASFKVENADPALPGAITDFAAAPNAQSNKSVDLTFKAPLNNLGGEALTTISDIQIYADNALATTIENPTPGQECAYTFQAPISRTVAFEVVARIDGEKGAAYNTSVVVGGEVPTSQDVIFGNANNEVASHQKGYAVWTPEGIKVTWDANASAASYKIYAYPGNTLVAQDITATEWVDTTPLAPGNSRWYQVVWISGSGSPTNHAKTNVMSIGNELPMNFVVTTNGDVMQGTGYSQFQSENFSSSFWQWNTLGNCKGLYNCPNNATYCLPGTTLKAGKHYRFDIWTAVGSGAYYLKATAGTSNTPEAQTIEIIPRMMIKNQASDSNTGERYQGYFEVPADGEYFVSINCSCDGRAQSVIIPRMQLVEVGEDLPGAIDDYFITFDPTDATKATVTVTAPSTNLAGNTLSSIDKIIILKDMKDFKEVTGVAPGEDFTFDVVVSPTEQCTYTLYAINSSGEGVSANIPVFIINAPYSQEFKDKKALNGWTLINNDPTSSFEWHIQAESARCYPEMDDTMDDWMITPPVHLEGGKYYKLNMVGWGDNMYETSEFSLWLGTEPKVEAMTEQVIDTWTVRGANRSEAALLKNYFTVPTTGEYYLGFHGYAENNGEPIWIDDFSISAPISGQVPGVCTDFSVKPDQKGALTGMVHFNVSPKYINGDEAGMWPTHTYIYIDGEQFIDLDMNRPGATLEVPVAVPTEGVHLITVFSENAQGIGREVETVAFFGINRPAAVKDIDVYETSQYGVVNFRWTPNDVDYDGFPQNPELVTYEVFRYNPEDGTETRIASGLKGSEYTYRVQADNAKQNYMRFGIRAWTTSRAGVKQGAPGFLAPFVSVGAPEPTPWKESFANYQPDMTFVTMTTGDGTPAMWGYSPYLSEGRGMVQPHDNDNGLAIMEVMFQDGGSRLMSGKIDLGGLEHPGLTCWVYNPANDEPSKALNTISFEARTLHGEWTSLRKETIADYTVDNYGWMKIQVDLAPFKDEVVYLGFNGQAKTHVFTIMDEITVGEYAPVNLVMMPCEAPSQAAPGRDFALTANIFNLSDDAVEEYDVQLWHGDTLLATKAAGGIAKNGKARVRFTHNMAVSEVGDHDFTFVAVHPQDGDASDDKHTLSVTLNESKFPAVTSLMAEQSAPGEVNVTWQPATLASEAAVVEEDFEAYDPWTNMDDTMGEWKMYDVDGLDSNGIVSQGVSFLPPKVGPYTKQAFFVFDSTYGPFIDNENYAPHSGGQCLMALAAYPNAQQTEDWLVSPVLYGKEQTVTFWARSSSEQYPETLGFYTNTLMEETAPASFSMVQKVEAVPAEWTKYEFTLPEGTQHFAITHESAGAFWMMIDDVTYTAGGDERLTLKGYNVFRNDELISKLQRAPRYLDTQAGDGTHKYSVSAMYDLGESPLTHVSFTSTGLDILSAGKQAVYGAKGYIAIAGDFARTDIFDAAGKHLYTVGAATKTIPATPGVYMVKADGQIFKVVVK